MALPTDELWRRGELSWKLKPVQKRMGALLARSRRRKKVLNCSRRVGKTFFLCVKALEMAIQKRRARIPYAASTQKMVRNMIHPIMRIISEGAPDEVRPVWSSRGFYTIPKTESEIHVAGTDNGNAESLRGTAADRAIVDEAGFIDELDYVVDSVLMPQLLTTGGDLIMASNPPRTPAHPFKAYTEEAVANESYIELDIYQSDYPPELIQEFMEEAGGEESTTWQREYLCKFVVDADYAIVPEWKTEFEGVTERDRFFKFYHVYAGMDIGVSDFTAVLFGYYDFRKARIVIEDELIMNGPQMTTDLLAGAIKAKSTSLYGSKEFYRQISDNNYPILLQDLGFLHGMNFQPVVKDSLEAMVNELRMNVAARKLYVNPKCKQTIGCLRYGVWDEHRKMFARTKDYGHYDALAALIYLNRNIDFHTNPIPATLEMEDSTHFINPDFGKNQNKEALAAMLGLNRDRDDAA